VQLSSKRQTAQEGVDAVRNFFHRNNCVFQEIAQQNDFGKDGYVDVGEGGRVTFLCAALQIKSGKSYRTAEGDYFIPVDAHAETWRHSTVPVFGLVYDPDDQEIRWIDITGYLRKHSGVTAGRIPVTKETVLSRATLHGQFKTALQGYSSRGFGALALNLLIAGPLQGDAVYDAWALGRSDSKYLLIIRRFIMDLDGGALRRAIHLLAHAGLHPDILWTPQNWIPPEVSKCVVASYRWSPEEIARMILAIDHGDYGRATLGQSLDVLLYEDPNVLLKLYIAIKLLLDESETYAVRAATLALTHSLDQRKEVKSLIKAYPALLKHEWFQEIAASITEAGDLSLY